MEKVVFSPLQRQDKRQKKKNKKWKRLSFDLCKGKKDPRICLNHSGDPGNRTNIHFVLIITDLKHCYVDKGFETLLCLITDLKQATFQGLAFASSRPNTRVRGTKTLALMICNCPAMCMLCLLLSIERFKIGITCAN